MTRLFAPPPRPTRCIHCGTVFQEGPLLEWQLCSSACANADRARRFQLLEPVGGSPNAFLLRLDYNEEQRQKRREERLQMAMVARHEAQRLGIMLNDHFWFELAEADLGNYAGAEITRRIDELVELYAARRARDPQTATFRPELLRTRLWAMVPMRLRANLGQRSGTPLPS